jgi:transcription antitermination factor NusG
LKRIGENPPERYPERSIELAELPWWVAKVKPRQEKALAFDFIKKNIEYYLPMVTKITKRKDNNKSRKSVITIFPGYISFCSDKSNLSAVFSTGRIVNIIEIKYQKRFISELSQIYGLTENNMDLFPCSETSIVGDEVEIHTGPLKGIKGTIAKIQNRNMLILNVDGLGRAMVSVDANQVKII